MGELSFAPTCSYASLKHPSPVEPISPPSYAQRGRLLRVQAETIYPTGPSMRIWWRRRVPPPRPNDFLSRSSTLRPHLHRPDLGGRIEKLMKSKGHPPYGVQEYRPVQERQLRDDEEPPGRVLKSRRRCEGASARSRRTRTINVSEA